jgi:hypothetical protein
MNNPAKSGNHNFSGFAGKPKPRPRTRAKTQRRKEEQGQKQFGVSYADENPHLTPEKNIVF